MKNNYTSQLHFISKHLFTLLVLGLLFIGVGRASGATITVSSNTNWSALTVGVGDIVYVRNGATLTVNVSNAACASLQIGGTTSSGAGFLAFSGTNPKITVSGLVQVGGWGNTNRDGYITFTNTATIDAGSIILGGTVSNNAQGIIDMTAGGTLRTGSLTVGAGSGTWTPGTGTGTVILDATNTLPATIFTNFNNLSTAGTGTTTTGANLTIGGNLNIGDGTTFTTATTNSLTVTGSTTIGTGTSGILNLGGWGGTKTFTGLVTVASGGTWNNSGNLAVNFRGGITNNGTFTSGSGTQTFDTNAQDLNGNINLTGAVTSFNANVTNNGNLTLTANVSGSGALINASTGTLNLSAYTTVTTLTNQGILNFTGANTVSTAFANFTNTGTLNLNGTNYILGITNNASGTVNYINASQTIGTFNNATATSLLNISALISSTSAINTLTATASGNTVNYSGAGDQTIKDVIYSNLTVSGSGTKTFAASTTINNTFTNNNNVIVNLGTGLTHTANTYYLGGTQQAMGSWGGTGSGATNINTSSFAAATGILNVAAGCAPGYWKGTTSSDWNIASNWCDGAVPTATTNVTIPSSAPNQPVIGTAGGLCNNITIGNGATLITSGSNNLVVSGTFTNNGTFTANNGSVTFNGTTTQSITGSTSTAFYNLTIQNTGTTSNNIITLGKPISVTGTLLLVNGIISTSNTNLLTVTSTPNSSILGGSATSFINGPVKWNLPSLVSGTTYTFPVGKGVTYLPFSLVNPVTSGNSSATVEAFDTGSGGTAPASYTISTSEYWQVTFGSNYTSSSVTLGKGAQSVFPYDNILGYTAATGTYVALGGTAGYSSVANSNTIGTNRFFALGSSTTPKINLSSTSFGSFGYIFNFGPSLEQSFIVNGTSLTADILITPGTDFEVSKTSGTGFQNSLTLTRSSGNVANTTIYIRLKAGLAVGNYFPENMTIVAGTASNTIQCNGTVFSTTPSITTSGGRACPPTDQINLYSSSDNITILYWTGPNGFYSINQNPVITPTTAAMNGTYTVTGSIPVGANLIINGDFESGVTGFTSSYTNSQTDLVPEGTYAVIKIPKTAHSGFSDKPDHSTIGNQMVINGAPTANVSIWAETVNVVPNSNYQFSYWVQSVVATNPSQLQLFANNVAVGATFTADGTLGPFKQFIYNWYSGSNTSVTLDLRNQNIIRDGNDFAIDDIIFRTVQQVTSSVNVAATATAAVSISTASTNVASGTNTTFYATPTNGGTSPLYQWKVNGTDVGSNSSSSVFNYTPSDGDVITCVMTSNNSCTDPKTATSNAITMTVTGTKNYWIGAVGAGGTAWNDPNNWTATKVPASGDNVEFATTANNSGVAARNDLYVDYNRIVGSIINNASGKNLIIPADKEVVVNNLITLTPVNTSSTYDQIQVKCDPNPLDASRLPNGSIIFKNASNVNGTVEMYCKANIVAGAANENDRYFWQYFGVPVTTVTAEPTLYGAYVRRANEAGDDNDATYYWTELTNGDALNAFIGHEICQTNPTIYTFKGQLVNTDFNFTNLAYTSSAKYPGQHLFANPYTAAIDIKKIQLGTDMEQSIFLYNTGSYGQWTTNTGVSSNGSLPGQYISVPLATAGSNNVPGEVPSMSSMLVKTGADKSAQSYMKFNYKDVIIKNSTIQRVKSVDAISSTDLVSTMIDLIGQHYSDRMWIFTEPSCTRNFDNGWDGRKILGSSLAPQIYAMEPDGDYQVNSVSDMHNTDLAFQAGDEVEYTLKFTHENIQQRYAGVYLVDLVENKTVDVTQSGSTYTFATAQSDAPAKRFKILTRSYEKDAPDAEAQVKIFTAPGRVFVQNLSTSKGECTLYDIAGRAIKNASFAANAVTEVLNNLTPGAYVVNTITNGEKVSKRVIVQ